MTRIDRVAIFAGIVMTWAGQPSAGEVRFANIFGSGGVLQHGKPLPVWGISAPGETVKVKLCGIGGCTLAREAATVADRHGKWIVTFDPLTAGDAFHLTVQGVDSSSAAYQMRAGDVWFYAGKYRFRYLRNIPQITEKGWREQNGDLFPLLRLYPINGAAGGADACRMPQRLEDGSWKTPEAYNIFNFSPGIMSHFAIELVREKRIPVGIVYAASIYGHSIDEYLSAETYVHDPVLGKTEAAKALRYSVGGTAECRQLNAERIAYMEKYLEKSVKDSDENRTVRDPVFPVAPEGAQPRISYMYNSAVQPVLPLAVKGVVYNDPGGPNPVDAASHVAKVELLVRSFRKWFNDPELPVFIIQDPAHRNQNAPESNAKFAAQQLVSQKDSHVELVVCHDIEFFSAVPDLFLKTIPAVGHRLYTLAERKVYGKASVNSETPTLTGFRCDNGLASLTFSMPLQTIDGMEPDGFAIKAAGQSVYHSARAEINGHTVTLSAPGVSKPEQASYGYLNMAIRRTPNVTGTNHMPIAAFSTALLINRHGGTR